MRQTIRFLAIALIGLSYVSPNAALAIGRGGGGGARAAAAGHIGAGGGGGRVAAARPHTSVPNLGAARANVANSGVGRPNVSRPNANLPYSRPNLGNAASRPNLGQSHGGLTPSTRPTTLPANISRPNLGSRPGGGNTPGSGINLGSRPNTSLPDLGGARPGGITRPGGGAVTLPGGGGGAVTLPGGGTGGLRPGGGGLDMSNRPTIPPATRPSLPNRPGVGVSPPITSLPEFGSRPGAGGGAITRPSPGDLGDFLGIGGGVRPGGGATTLPGRIPPVVDGRPGLGNLPNLGNRPGGGLPDLGNLPNLVDRPGIGDRPGVGNRPGIVDRPGIGDGSIGVNRPNFGDRDRWTNNGIISNRPSWSNINNSVNINIQNNWNNAIVNAGRPGWWNRPANRIGYWNTWGNSVRTSWAWHHGSNWFGSTWWTTHFCPIGGWHYHFGIRTLPWTYWWRTPTWGVLTGWFVWSAPAVVWSQPIFYDYGVGGNVTFVNNQVYVGGEPVATTSDFAASAMNLATVAPPVSQEQAAQAEWMPLGTFAVSMNEKDTRPSMVTQLAVSREGIVSGMLYNVDTDQTQVIQGQVDKETQRVAFRIGENETIVAETGLYNLTQDEAPVLVHFGPDQIERYLLVRLEEPPADDAG